MEIYRSYGPAGTDISRPPKLSSVQMNNRLLHVIDTGQVVYLPTGHIRSFDEMRQWTGWEPDLRDRFDAWALSNSRKVMLEFDAEAIRNMSAQHFAMY